MSNQIERPGLLVAIYGTNNLGKSEQVRRLMARLLETGVAVRSMKYPLYDLEPFGPAINSYLREGNPEELTTREFQLLQVANRTQFDWQLKAYLSVPGVVVLEDYSGTGIAWGAGAGCKMDWLIEMNSHLLTEDIAILLDGERFTTRIETGHRHEEDDDLTRRVRTAHLELAQRFGWQIVNANQTPEEVHEEIWTNISSYITKT